MKLTLNIELEKLNTKQLTLLAKITDPEQFPLIRKRAFSDDFLAKYFELEKHAIAKNIFENAIAVECERKEFEEKMPAFLRDRAVFHFSDSDGSGRYFSTSSIDDVKWIRQNIKSYDSNK